MYDTRTVPQLRVHPVIRPQSRASQPAITLIELAGCMVIAAMCVDMWLGIYTLVRCGIYIVAVILALAGSGFKARISPLGGLFFLTGGLYILKALLYPPVPSLVRNDIRNILVGFAFLATFGMAHLTQEAWRQFQFKLHRTMVLFSTLGAVLGLAKLFYYNQGGVIPYLMDPERGYPLGTSLTMDYNFYSLPLLLGILSAFWLMKRDGSSLWRTLALVSLPLLVVAVLFSGSRRGLIVLACAVPFLAAWLIFGRREPRPEQAGSGAIWKAALTILGCVLLFCALQLDSVSQAVQEVTAADSLSDVWKRWQTFQEGTYSDSRVYYWTVTLQRLSHFRFLDFLFGQGFGYVTDLGADPDLAEDYPHNFVLSSMLYGGVLQTSILLMMVFLAFTQLAFGGNRSLLGGWFLLVVFFLSTSCNSFFSSEIAVFLTVVALALKLQPIGFLPLPGARRIQMRGAWELNQ